MLPRLPSALLAGSSPLTRGKHSEALHGLAQGRLIPAHAGKTSPISCIRSRIWAHPRSRGENTADDALTQQPAGSSPLTRGKLGHAGARTLLTGLIPAHAGKTSAPQKELEQSAAHPRSRGENSGQCYLPASCLGSSPLTRGKREPVNFDRLDVRLIPAHAGKTGDKESTTGGFSAHPRSRGENLDVLRHGHAAAGSSPLTRGKLVSFDGTTRFNGLIPAHAGKTTLSAHSRMSRPAHPRSRGENPR